MTTMMIAASRGAPTGAAELAMRKSGRRGLLAVHGVFVDDS